MFNTAIVRKPCKNFSAGLTTSELGKPNYDIMLKQHAAYANILKGLGLNIIELDPLDEYPDAHFVEDTAVIVPEAAIITHPGAKSRRGEVDSIESELKKHKNCFTIISPGKLDGGDVFIIKKNVYVGISGRTNNEGAEQLLNILSRYGYNLHTIPLREGLHLKSDVNYLGNNTLIMTENYSNDQVFERFNRIYVECNERYAANSLLINDKVLIPKGFPKIKNKLENVGFQMIELEMSESQKMDGGLTCLSLRF